MRLVAYGLTDVGRKREHNEDALLLDDELPLYMVADGVGGHAAGEFASTKAIQVVREHLVEGAAAFLAYGRDPQDFELRDRCLSLVEAAVQRASAEIFAIGRRDVCKRGMGTTCVLLVGAGAKAVIGHVGDSRVYLQRDEDTYQLTEDHTLVAAHLKQGLITEEEAARAPHANVITRCVGYQESVEVDTLVTDLLPGDRFLLCSDGLSHYVRSEEWSGFLRANDAGALPGKLIELANARGGHDNVTALVVTVDAPRAADAKAEVEERMGALRSIPLFRHLTYKEMIQVISVVRAQSVPARHTIIEEDKEGDTLYVLLRGSAEVTKGGKPMAVLAAGQHFGEMALIDKAPRSASVVATTDCSLLTILRDEFYGLMRKDPVLAVKLLWSFLQQLTARLRVTTEELTGALALGAHEQSED